MDFSSDNSETKTEDMSLLAEENTCNCLIEDMLNRKFSSLPVYEKEIIVNTTKPSPVLNIEAKTKTFKRHFNREIYEKVGWICGCAYVSKLFCWPCILFSPEINVWSRYGFNDLNNLSKASRRHECSQSHIWATVQFKKFCKETGIEDFSSVEFKAKIEMHNKEVSANRYILSKLISCICFLMKQSDGCENKNYVDLLYLLSESDIKLKTHLENSTEMTRVLNEIHSDIVSAIGKVVIDEIRIEISASKFVSLILDGSTQNITSIATIFRYVDDNNDIQERFVGFVDVGHRTADAVFEHIHKIIEEFQCWDKLISHTYDGAAIMPWEHNEMQRKIQNICPNALFTHCYAHRLDLVLSQSVKHIPRCKRFFNHVTGFSYFFSKSPKRVSLLDVEIKKRFPTAAPSRWNSTSQILNIILDFHEELEAVFSQVAEDEENEWDTDAVINAEVLQYYLKDFDFNFNLHLFSMIFNSADFLVEILQRETFHISHSLDEIKKFVKFLDERKNDFDSFWNKILTENFNKKRKNSDCVEDMKIRYKREYCDILDSLAQSTTNRFQHFKNFKFMELFNMNRFKEYEKNFPDFLFKSLQQSYEKCFDFMRLKSELTYMYSTPEFHLKSIHCIKKLIVKDDLADVLAEVFRLIQLICTIPYASPSGEKSSSTIDRIKTSIKNITNEGKLSDLALISVEKKLMSRVKNKEEFYDLVIDEFCKKDSGIKLNFVK